MQEAVQTEAREFTPIFDEVAEMTPEQAVNILVQVAGLAQESGKLNLRDSVMLAKAISVVTPGRI